MDPMPTVRKKKKNPVLSCVRSVEAVKEKGRATGEGGVEGITRERTTEVSKRVGKDGPSSESHALTPEQWLAALLECLLLEHLLHAARVIQTNLGPHSCGGINKETPRVANRSAREPGLFKELTVK